MEIPLGWQTDLAVLRLSGSSIEDRGDHVVVATPQNPTYHWGNFLLVTDPAATGDPGRWLAAFEREFPDAEHRAIGLVAEPDREQWLTHTLFLEVADVLIASSAIPATPVPDGYQVRRLESETDWAQSTALRNRAFPGQDEFELRTTRSRRAMAAQADAPWFGAFAGDELAAELGIVVFGDGRARYRSVNTHPDHRRRGLARHLLAVAAQHALGRGARHLVIVADGDSDAARLYRRAGFAFDSPAYQVSRMPGISPVD